MGQRQAVVDRDEAEHPWLVRSFRIYGPLDVFSISCLNKYCLSR